MLHFINSKSLSFALFCCTGIASIIPLHGDTLQLADGSSRTGEFVGSSNKIIMFQSSAGMEAFPHAQVLSIQLGEEVKTAEPASPPPAASMLSVPVGTRLLIRTVDGIDSRRHPEGHRFRAKLESALVVDGVTVAPLGTTVYGRIVSARNAGRLAGTGELTIEFSDILLNSQLYPIATSDLQAKTGNEAGRTVRRAAGAAAIGGLIDGKDGAKTGAKVGAGAAILTRGASINIPSGTLIETQLRVPLSVSRS